MTVMFNQAIRYEWLETGKNPITPVSQSTARQKAPEVLDPHEIQNYSESIILFGIPVPPHCFARGDDRFASIELIAKSCKGEQTPDNNKRARYR